MSNRIYKALSAHAKKRVKNFNFCASWKSPCLVIEKVEDVINFECRTLRLKKSNLKKEKTVSSMKEKTGSSDRRRGSIPISLRDHSSRDRLCADHYDPTDTDEDATLRESERNYFCSISPVLTLSGPRWY